MSIQQSEMWLKIAIDRHQRHMDGKEPTTGKVGEMSQMLMMEEMKMAYKGLFRDDVKPSSWYNENSKKM